MEIPLGRFVCLTGVSGSGKTTLAREVLYPLLQRHLAAPDRASVSATDVDAAEESKEDESDSPRRASDSATLSGEARGALGQASSVMKEYDKTAVVVQGHTDSTGTEEHNQGLSERRAHSVVENLVAEGVNRDRIASMGFGESQPVADNSTSEGRRRNRRVDVMLRAKAK